MMNVPHGALRWRKSSYSAQETDCIEVADTLKAVRDSKNPGGPELRVPMNFFAEVKAGKLDR